MNKAFPFNNSAFALGVCFFSLSPNTLLAHGGGGPDMPKTKQKAPSAESRLAPINPSVLNDSALKKIMIEDKNPNDVAVIKCTLSAYSNCRGLQVSLYDLNGKKLIAGNSGSEGYVGFEGLDRSQNYEVRIESKRYRGATTIAPGSMWNLNGELIVE